MPAFGIVHVDSTAALGVIRRRGNGRMRHVRVGQLWIQERESEELKVQGVDGKVNLGDLLAEHVPKKTLYELSQMLSCRFCQREVRKFFETPMSGHWRISFIIVRF